MTTQLSSQQHNKALLDSNTQHHTRAPLLVPAALFLVMLFAYLFVDAVLPLYGLWFHTALLPSLGSWVLLPTHLLFPNWQLTPTLTSSSNGVAPPFVLSWRETGLLLLAFVLVFVCYFIALHVLTQRVGIRFILLSTMLLGLVLIIAPIVTSQDIYSYIIYARMQVLYHLNPLITSPMSIASDPTYRHLYWTNQPSAYGPTWISLTSILQWFTSLFGTNTLTPMLLALRILNLLAHLGSTLLLWSMSTRLKQIHGYKKPIDGAVLAFAWNPLLLFEACVNGHNDILMILLVLLALWCLVRWSGLSSYLVATLIFALATCLKVNAALLLPGLLLFIWMHQQSLRVRLQHLALILSVYIVVILALYAPFWSHGNILLILHVNPGTYRATNSIPEFLSHLYNSLVSHSTQESGFPAEEFLRILSEGLFVVAYLVLCWHAFRTRLFTTPGTSGISGTTPLFFGMTRWMTMAWLLYCLLGSPWFWPWYLIVFFGLFALLETNPGETLSRYIPAVRVLACTMVSIYCFYTWSPYGSFVPLLFHFRWAYLRGLWAWLIPLCILSLPILHKLRTKSVIKGEGRM